MARSQRTQRKSYVEQPDIDDDLDSEPEPKPKTASTSQNAPSKAVHARTSIPRKRQKARGSDDEAWTTSANSKKRKGKKTLKAIDKIKRGSLSKLMELPIDILVTIFSALEPADIYHLSLVNKELYRFLWKPSATTIYKNIQQNLSFQADLQKVIGDWWFEEANTQFMSCTDVPGSSIKTYSMPDPPIDRCWPAYFRDFCVQDVCVDCGTKCAAMFYQMRNLARRNLCRACTPQHMIGVGAVSLQWTAQFGVDRDSIYSKLIARFNYDNVFQCDVEDAMETYQGWMDNGQDETDRGIILEDRNILREELCQHNDAFNTWNNVRRNYLDFVEREKATQKAEARTDFIRQLCNRLAEDESVEANSYDCQELHDWLRDKRGKRDWFAAHNGQPVTEALYTKFRQNVGSTVKQIVQFRKQKTIWDCEIVYREIAQEEFVEWHKERKVNGQSAFWPPVADLFGSGAMQKVIKQWIKDEHTCVTLEEIEENPEDLWFCDQPDCCDESLGIHYLTEKDRVTFRKHVQDAKSDILAAVDTLHDDFKLQVLSLLPGRDEKYIESEMLSSPRYRFKCTACPRNARSRFTWPTLFEHSCIHLQRSDGGWDSELKPVYVDGFYSLMPRYFHTKLITLDVENYKIMSNIALYLGPEEAAKLPQTHEQAKTWLDAHRIACSECEDSKTNQAMSFSVAVNHCENETKLFGSNGTVISAFVHGKIKVVDYKLPTVSIAGLWHGNDLRAMVNL